MYKNRKAVSPVIATVILVAVAITISVAVAYWMGGISSQYTKFEKVEITNAVVTIPSGGGGWEIKVSLKNTGTAQATLTNVFVNNNEVTGVSPQVSTWVMDDDPAGNPYSKTISSGAIAKLTLTIDSGDADFSALSAGTTVNLKFHSAGGMDYLKLIELV